jgi:hypothetical protein
MSRDAFYYFSGAGFMGLATMVGLDAIGMFVGMAIGWVAWELTKST